MKSPPAEKQDEDDATAHAVHSGHVVFIDREDQQQAADSRDTGTEGDTPSSPAVTNSLLSTGVEILSGPARGKRIYFTHEKAALGVREEIAVVIKRDGQSYTAQKAGQSFIVTINGDVIDDDPVAIHDGDQLSFANLSARFFVQPDSIRS